MKRLLFTLGVSVMLGSCTISHSVVVTNNPIGSKRGEATTANMDVNTGVSYSTAIAKGDISKVGIAEYKMKTYVFSIRESMIVTGE